MNNKYIYIGKENGNVNKAADKVKPIEKRKAKMWAVFAPDNEIQMRSIAELKKLSQYYIHQREDATWEDYKKAGFYTKKVEVTIKIRK